ncbi:hypothetical protein PpBr36_04011 [Pyricularia pennisetigena]|uniref:hypothetical protein n=1 Tax=Pyricularia pennisetigena TaxID=1578925 RepID=UPI0011537B21|nr:hypothetical protein PpBr36_04011 [Pyricularia pennisetigena]TLS26982.1 hypothetical protein PpBr36_04011 [Pyricularia pennisetigena]
MVVIVTLLLAKRLGTWAIYLDGLGTLGTIGRPSGIAAAQVRSPDSPPKLGKHRLQLLDLFPELLHLQHCRLFLDVGLGQADSLVPSIALKVQLVFHLLPLLLHVVVFFATRPVGPDLAGRPHLEQGREEQERRVQDGHDDVVEPLVHALVHPPLKGQRDQEHLDEVEGRDVDVLVGRAHELHRLLRKQRQELVVCIFVNVLVGRVVQRNENVEQDDHDDEGEEVVEYDAERVAKLFKAAKVGALHERVGHGLDDEARVAQGVVVCVVEADEALEEADDDDGEQREEDDGLLHHDLENDQHGAEEAERVEVQQQPDPEERRADGQKVVAELVELLAVRLAIFVLGWPVYGLAKGEETNAQADHQQPIENAIQSIPEPQDAIARLPDLGDLVANETERKEVHETLDDIKFAGAVDRADGARVQAQIDEGNHKLGCVLVDRGAHAIGVHVDEEAGVSLVMVVNKVGGIILILNQPTAPQVTDAFLIARGADDAQGMQVDGAFNDVGRGHILSIDGD